MKKIDLLPLLGFFVVLTACHGQDVSPTPPPTTPIPSSTVTTQPKSESIVWQDQSFEARHMLDKDVVLFHGTYLLPGIANSELDAAWTAIDDYYRTEGEAYLKTAQETADLAKGDYDAVTSLGYDFTPYAEESFYSVSYQSEHLVSIRRTYYSDMGNDFPVTFQFSEQFDLSTGSELSSVDFFDGTATAQILAGIQAQATQRGGGQSIDMARLESNFDAEAFYLTEDSFVFYYQPGDAAASEQGAIEFSIPKASLGYSD